jgi:hypothetical protein
VVFAGCGDDGTSNARIDSFAAVADSPAEGCVTCDNDSALEPNESIQAAHVVSTYTLDGLAICPVGDKDYYSINLATPGTNLEMLVLYEAAGAELQGALLNSSGLSIATATATSGGKRTKRAYLPNLPTGIYYAEVTASPSGTNNYRLWLSVTGP